MKQKKKAPITTFSIMFSICRLEISAFAAEERKK